MLCLCVDYIITFEAPDMVDLHHAEVGLNWFPVRLSQGYFPNRSGRNTVHSFSTEPSTLFNTAITFRGKRNGVSYYQLVVG